MADDEHDAYVCPCRAGHPTWGACIRAKNIRIGQVDATEQKKWDRDLALYREARDGGLQPNTTKRADVEATMEAAL